MAWTRILTVAGFLIFWQIFKIRYFFHKKFNEKKIVKKKLE